MAKPKQRWMPPIPSVGVLGQLIGAGPHGFSPFMWECGTEMAAQAALGWAASAGGRLGKAVCSAGLAAAHHPASGCRILKDGEGGVGVWCSRGGLWLRRAGGFPLNAAEGNQVSREAGLPRAGAVGCLPQQAFRSPAQLASGKANEHQEQRGLLHFPLGDTFSGEGFRPLSGRACRKSSPRHVQHPPGTSQPLAPSSLRFSALRYHLGQPRPPARRP